MNEEIPIEPESQTVSDAPTGALELIERAAIDMQIATAKRYPRTISKVKEEMTAFATLDEATAATCFYTLPRGGKVIQGPSIRMAEIAIACYGNIRAGSRIISTVTDGATPHVVAQSVVHDLEKNIVIAIEKRGRIFQKKDRNGGKKPVDEDDVNLACNRCSAIALRDATFKVIPLALIKPVYEKAKKVAVGDAKSFARKRNEYLARIKQMGVLEEERVFAVLGVRKQDDILPEHLETLIGLATAIKDGEATIEEAFPPVIKGQDPAPAMKVNAAEPPTPKPEPAPHDPEQPTPQQELQAFMETAGVSFDDFRGWLGSTGRHPDPTQFADYSQLPTELCEKLRADAKAIGKCVSLYGKKKE